MPILQIIFSSLRVVVGAGAGEDEAKDGPGEVGEEVVEASVWMSTKTTTPRLNDDHPLLRWQNIVHTVYFSAFFRRVLCLRSHLSCSTVLLLFELNPRFGLCSTCSSSVLFDEFWPKMRVPRGKLVRKLR